MFNIKKMRKRVCVIVLALFLSSPAIGAETEKGIGGYYGTDTSVTISNRDAADNGYGYEVGFINPYYGWLFGKKKDLHLGFELPIGYYSWDDGSDEFSIGINAIGTYDYKKLYFELGVGTSYITGSPSSDETISTGAMPCTVLVGAGYKLVMDDGYFRIGLRVVHTSGLLDGGDPGVNPLGLFVSYYW